MRAAVVLGVALTCVTVAAQPPAAQLPAPASGSQIAVERTDDSVPLVYANRRIVVLRARVLGRAPADRVRLALRTLDDLVVAGRTAPVVTLTAGEGVLVGVGSQVVVGLTETDLDPAAGETLQGVVDQTVARMQLALEEAAEARRPATLLRSAVVVLLVSVGGLLALWALGRTRPRVTNRLSLMTRRAIAGLGMTEAQASRVSQLLEFLERRVVGLIVLTGQLFVVYVVVTFALRRFPYTRPWGESLREFLVAALAEFALGMLRQVPQLFTVVVIVAVTRFVIRALRPLFDLVERGAIMVPWLHRETAATTRRLTTIALWLFAATVVYPYIPGSETEAFKGISVIVGLMVTLGSSGIVNQITSGVMITYSRALRIHDFVKVGDVEGTITQLGVLSTKMTTLRLEEITIPNVVVVSQMTTDYSRFSDNVVTTTAITIGYEAPWRQVHAMLLQAAERTPGIRREPRPTVMQTALEDLAVKYTLLFTLERQQTRNLTRGILHQHIQDLFNEYGVQIMTPRYESDPDEPKLVPKQKWYAAPAGRESIPAKSGDTP